MHFIKKFFIKMFNYQYITCKIFEDLVIQGKYCNDYFIAEMLSNSVSCILKCSFYVLSPLKCKWCTKSMYVFLFRMCNNLNK